MRSKKGRQRAVWAIVMVGLCCVSCASYHRRDIESALIAAMEEKCKTVELKTNGEVYVIDPTQRLSDDGCPIALITGWRDGVIIMEKEVEVCACRKGKY